MVSSQVPPQIDQQIRDCEQVFVRARPHLEALDTQRATVEANIDEGAKKIESRKLLQQNQPPPLPKTQSEVQRLQALVAQLQSQLVKVGVPTLMTIDSRTSKGARLREDFVPNSAGGEELKNGMECNRTMVGAGLGDAAIHSCLIVR